MSSLRERLFARDPSLWPDGNVSHNRLGWLDVPRRMEAEAAELRHWADSIEHETIVLLGMGGSSLGPAVLAACREAPGGFAGRRIVVCDTTDPTTVASLPLEDAFVLVSSKSGTTLEPNVLWAYARSRLDDPQRYAVITDPGTPLAEEARGIGVNRVFENQPDIGGRYSVLSYFGMVPAALAGYDVEELCSRALDVDHEDGIELGMDMGQAAAAGRDKVTIVVDEAYRSFGLWVEQLIAESTGKQGRGCVPIPTTEDEEGDDRHRLDVRPADPGALGELFYRLEIATAVAGHALGIDPFDEPNVAESKANTNRVLDELPLPEVETAEPRDVAPFLQEKLRAGDYVSVQAYLPYGVDDALEALRRRLRDAHHGVAVTAGYGPRFLHSTGQLHKGGPDSLVALQIVRASEQPQVAIPGKPYDFGTLISAQTIGDHESLQAHGRRVLRVALDDLGEIA